MNSKVILAHIPYQTRGGEDVHVSMLKNAYSKIGIETVSFPPPSASEEGLLRPSLRSLAPTASFLQFEKFYEEHAPAVIHLHNAFPLLGPRFFRWAEKKKVPLLYTIHNHRFFCTNGLALRDGKNCRQCMPGIPWGSLAHNCNGSWVKTIYHFLSLSQLRVRNQLQRSVSLFLAPSPYIREQLIESGIDEQKIRLLVHACDAPPLQPVNEFHYDVVYAGRLSAEKGVHSLLDAIKRSPGVRFLVIGDGPEAKYFTDANFANLHYRPNRTHAQVLEAIRDCKIGVVPSLCNEILSLFSLELLVQGKRCVMSKTDSSKWFESMGYPCMFAKVGDGADLARAIQQCLHLPLLSLEETQKMRKRFSFERFLQELKGILEEVQMTGKSS